MTEVKSRVLNMVHSDAVSRCTSGAGVEREQSWSNAECKSKMTDEDLVARHLDELMGCSSSPCLYESRECSIEKEL